MKEESIQCSAIQRNVNNHQIFIRLWLSFSDSFSDFVLDFNHNWNVHHKELEYLWFYKIILYFGVFAENISVHFICTECNLISEHRWSETLSSIQNSRKSSKFISFSCLSNSRDFKWMLFGRIGESERFKMLLFATSLIYYANSHQLITSLYF